MIEFRGRKCAECAWMRKIVFTDYYGRNTQMNCTNAACRLEDVKLRSDSRACPAFVPLKAEESIATQEAANEER